MKPTILAVVSVIACGAMSPAPASAQVLANHLQVNFRNHLLRDALIPDSRFARARSEEGVDSDALRDYFERRGTGGYLTAGTARLYGIEQYQVSRVQVALEGAERVASAAMFASALGTTFGGWDEDKAMTFVGAAAAVGALWGGVVHGDDPGWRLRYRWQPDR